MPEILSDQATFSQGIRLFFAQKQVKFVTKINGFLYFFRKIPVLGPQISSHIYGYNEVKKGLSKVIIGVSILITLLINTGSFLALTAIGELLLTWFTDQRVDFMAGSYLWWFFVCVCWGFLAGFDDVLSRQDSDFITHFWLSKKTFIQLIPLLRRCYQFSLYLPVLFLCSVFTGGWGTFFLLTGSYFGFWLLGRWSIKTWFKHPIASANVFYYLYLIVSLSVGGWLLYTKNIVTLSSLVANGWVGLSAWFITSVLFIYLYRKSANNQAYVTYQLQVSQERVAVYQKAKQMQRTQTFRQGLALQEKLTLTNEYVTTDLTGSQYLNKLLFSRYRPQLRKGLHQRLIGLGGGWLLAIIVGIVARKHLPPEQLFKLTTSLLPLLFIFFYFIGYGKKVVELVFVNCDSAMLYYPAYREPKVILAGFLYRFKYIIRYNSLLALGTLAIIATFTLVSGGLPLAFYGTLLLLLTALTLLFSFHELFVYYLLQPFTADLEVVNPLYKIISGLFYGLAYGNTQIHVSGLFYSIVISLVAFVYVGVGLMVIYRKAPQTFVMKQ